MSSFRMFGSVWLKKVAETHDSSLEPKWMKSGSKTVVWNQDNSVSKTNPLSLKDTIKQDNKGFYGSS